MQKKREGLIFQTGDATQTYGTLKKKKNLIKEYFASDLWTRLHICDWVYVYVRYVCIHL